MNTAIEDRVFAKVLRRVLLPLALLTLVMAIDRMNVSFAGAALSRELGLTPSAFGTGVSMFFVAYLLFQYPHALLLRKWGIRRWLLISVSIWGLASLAMTWVQAPWHFYAARFVLGVAESGFAPGMMWLIGQWTSQHTRGRALGLVLAAVPIALMIGGPLCGFLLGMSNPLQLSGWRWMFLVSSLPNFVLAIAAFFYFTERPSDATWLLEDEKRLLESQREITAPGAQRAWLGSGARDARLWRCALTWFCIMTGSYALVFWLPQLVRQLAPGASELVIGTLSALPPAGLALGLFLNGWHSDRSGERIWHVTLGAVLGAAMLLVAALLPAGAVTLALLTLAGIGLGGAQGVSWTLPAALGIGNGKPPVEALAIISMLGTAGGIVGPIVVGMLVERTGSFTLAIVFLAALLLVAAAIVATSRPRATHEEIA